VRVVAIFVALCLLFMGFMYATGAVK